MAKPYDSRVEHLELGLLAADAAAAGHLLLEPNADRLGNIICFPLIGLVTEEALTYFAGRRREARIGSLDGKLQREFRGAVKKVRARLKLLDDNDKGHEELAAFMRVARTKSRVLFEHPSNSFMQFLSGPFRPDLGVFFAGEYVVGTSHAALSTMGVTRDLVEAARPGEFKPFEGFVQDFSISLGEHLATLKEILAPLGLTLELQRRPLADPVTITHLDFVSEKFYRRVEIVTGLKEPGEVGVFTMCLSQVNACLYVLPRLLGGRSDLLFRAQFLTAFHASRSLRRVLAAPPRWLATESGDVVELRPLRDLLAHYGLRQSAHFAIGVAEPLMAAVEGVAGVPAEQVRASTTRRLEALSEMLSTGLRKADLAPFKALLGCHT